MATAQRVRGDLDLYGSLMRQGAVLLGNSALDALLGQGDNHPAPSATNQFLAKSEREVVKGQASTGTTLDIVPPNGISVVEAVYGFARGHSCFATCLFARHTNTGDGNTLYGSIMASTNRWSYSTTSWSVVSDSSVNMKLRLTVDGGMPGQVTVFATRLRSDRY